MVFGRGPNERHSSDVDFFDCLGYRDVDFGDGVFERVEITDHIIDLFDVLFREILFVRLEVSRQDTGVDSRVKGLDST